MSNLGVDSSLEKQREEFIKNRFLATPLAGMLTWLAIGIAGHYLPANQVALLIYIGAGSIFMLGIFLSKFTGEYETNKKLQKNTFQILFYIGVAQAILVFSIALPFASYDTTSIPLSVGILTGLMWLPFSWIIKHWVGFFHTISRTISIVLLWYLFPEHRFVAIPAVIVLIYIISIIAMEKRFRSVQ